MVQIRGQQRTEVGPASSLDLEKAEECKALQERRYEEPPKWPNGQAKWPLGRPTFEIERREIGPWGGESMKPLIGKLA